MNFQKLLLHSLLVQSILAGNIAKSNTLEQKKQYCLDNQFTCSVFCLSLVKENTCDTQTLNWKCLCKDGYPPKYSQFEYPIAIRQCEAELLECVDECRKVNPANFDCSAQCKNVKKCGTSRAEQSTSFMVTSAGEHDKASKNANTSDNVRIGSSLGMFMFALSLVLFH